MSVAFFAHVNRCEIANPGFEVVRTWKRALACSRQARSASVMTSRLSGTDAAGADSSTSAIRYGAFMVITIRGVAFSVDHASAMSLKGSALASI